MGSYVNFGTELRTRLDIGPSIEVSSEKNQKPNVAGKGAGPVFRVVKIFPKRRTRERLNYHVIDPCSLDPRPKTNEASGETRSGRNRTCLLVDFHGCPDKELRIDAVCQPGPMAWIGINAFDRRRPFSVLSKTIDGMSSRLLSRSPEYPAPSRLYVRSR